MKAIIGTSNRGLEINLSNGEVTEFTISPQIRRAYLGAKGLGLKLLYDRMQPGIDPLGEENYLAFMTGVMMGTAAPCSGRFSAITKSPLTGIMLTSSCGGPFGMAYKTAGYDALLITGRSDTPVYLTIDEKGVVFEDAAAIWGKDTKETQEALNPDNKNGMLVIGPAGENRVNIANVASGHRFFGRGGMGAVMGAKNLKAVIAKGGACRIVPKDQAKFKKVKKRSTRYINRHPVTSKAYRNFGTGSHVDWCNEKGLLPVHNFRSAGHELADLVSGESMGKAYQTRPSTCKPCSILCGHKGTLADGSVHQIPEYETIGLLGPNLGVFDADRIVEWNDTCGLLGMDTISSGAILAYVMEAGEKGLIDTPLCFGSPEGISQALKDMAFRRGFGDEMANGTRYLSEKFGGKAFAIQIKGLEMAAYDPRGAWGQGLSYAVANRGACHLSAASFALEAAFGYLNPFTMRSKAMFVRFFENLYAGINSLQACQFVSYAYVQEPVLVKYTPNFILHLLMQYIPRVAIGLMDVSIFSKFYSAVMGVKMSQWEFLRAGNRIHLLERYMNTREGISRKDDTLPDRFLKEGRISDPDKRTVPLDEMLNAYYKIRGYDHSGIVKPATLEKAGIRLTPGESQVDGSKHFKMVTPGGKRIKSVYMAVMLWFVGRSMQAASRVDEGVKKEFENIPDDFTFSLGVAPNGPYMVVRKDEDGRVSYLGSKINRFKVDLRMDIKNLEAAILLFTFQEKTSEAACRDRFLVSGDLPLVCSLIRILDMVEVFLLPKMIAKLAVKRYPNWSPMRKYLGRGLIYVRAIMGI